MPKYSQSSQGLSATLKWLHLGLAVSASLALGCGLGLKAACGSVRDLLAIGHEWLGLLALVFALLHWGWLWEGHDGGIARLLPRGRQAWQKIALDFWGLFKLCLPEGGARVGLPSLAQGVGLGLVTVQGLVGLGMFVLSSPQGELPLVLAWLKSWHQGLGWGVLGYWVIHVGMVLAHLWRRDGVVSAMLPWR